MLYIYFRGGKRCEGDGIIIDWDISCVENNEVSICDNIYIDGDCFGESIGDEIGDEMEIVLFWDGEFGEMRLIFEFIYFCVKEWLLCVCFFFFMEGGFIYRVESKGFNFKLKKKKM